MMKTLSYRLGKILCNFCFSFWEEFNWESARPVIDRVYRLGCNLQCKCVDEIPMLDDLIRYHRKGKLEFGKEPFRFYITARHKKEGSYSEVPATKMEKILNLYL